jgi:hypothetical protein
VTKDTQAVLALLDALAIVSKADPVPTSSPASTPSGATVEVPSRSTRGTRDVAAEQQLLKALDNQDFDLFAALAHLWSDGD